jgi:hypothetical protein
VVDVFDSSVLSQERINEEIEKILDRLNHGRSGFVEVLLRELRVFKRFFDKDKEIKVIQNMVFGRSFLPLAIAMKDVHGIKSICEEAKLPVEMKRDVQIFELVEAFFSGGMETKRLMQMVSKLVNGGVSHSIFKMVKILWVQNRISQGWGLDLIGAVTKIECNDEPFLVKHLAINGMDLQQSGFQGKEIGVALNEMLELVWENPALNDKETLLEKLNSK